MCHLLPPVQGWPSTISIYNETSRLYEPLRPKGLVDTAQGYGNEGEVGIALHRSAALLWPRWAQHPSHAPTPTHNLHSAVPDIPTVWARIAKVVGD